MTKPTHYRKRFRKLISKYLKGTATSEQSEAVEQYYTLFSEEPDRLPLENTPETDAMGARLRSGMASRIQKEKHTSSSYLNIGRGFRIAAALLICLGVAVALYNWQYGMHKEIKSPIKPVSLAPAESNHFITLPDGTNALLRKGSTLTYGKDFNQTTREVTLIGEAYFDVVKVNYADADHKIIAKPFIIHTGKVKTTVLGTAFEIKAWPQSKKVMVSVIRGKVQVEDQHRIIAVLTRDKQVSYDVETTKAGQSVVEPAKFLSWASEDMTFDNMSFETLADHLEKRYHIEIIFQNPELRYCSFTGRFNGTETWEEVIKILTATSKTTYKIKTDNQVVIEGSQCN